MRKNLLLYVVPMALLIVLSGCKKDDSNPLDSNINTTQSPTQPMPSFGSTADFNGVLSTIMYDMDAPIPGIPPVQMTSAFASLGAQGGVDGGNVAVNSAPLGKLVVSGKTTYMAPDPNNPTASFDAIYFNGSNHSWSVSGGNGIPGFGGSVKSVSNFNMVSPASNASVSKSGDLSVIWNGGTTNKVLIQITSISNGNTKVYQELFDNGSYKIPSADLSALGGSCLLYVVKYNYNLLTVSGKKYAIISEIVKSVKINVN